MLIHTCPAIYKAAGLKKGVRKADNQDKKAAV